MDEAGSVVEWCRCRGGGHCHLLLLDLRARVVLVYNTTRLRFVSIYCRKYEIKVRVGSTMAPGSIDASLKIEGQTKGFQVDRSQ